LRGWSHAAGAILAVAGTIVLVSLTASQAAKAATMVLYGASLVLLLGVSAVYHIGYWETRVRTTLRALDHADIFFFIAATYTAIGFNVLTGYLRVGILASVWILAAVGMATLLPGFRLPRWALAGVYVGMGWIGVVAAPQIAARLGVAALLFILLGGLLYSIGALAYALRRPRLWPRTFGYHEVFHLLVLGASASFFVVLAVFVAPAHRA
jgi:hemolysin III